MPRLVRVLGDVFIPSTSWLRSAIALLLALAVFLPRTANLGQMLTNDEPIWQGRAHRFILGIATLQPNLTFSGGQPGVTTMWVAGLADRFASVRASQFSIAIASGILLLLAVVLLSRVAGPTAGILAGFFLAFDNFLTAHSRVVHTDAFLALGVLVTLLLLALVWKTRALRYLALAGVSTSFAILSKLMGGLLLLPGLVTVFAAPLRASRIRRLRSYAVSILLVIILGWPAVWNPLHPIRVMSQRLVLHSQETDFGKGGRDPLYYPREWFFRLNPVSTAAGALGFLGALLGTGRLLPRLAPRRFWFTLPVTIAAFGGIMSFGGQRSDRYFLMGNLVVDVLAAGGVLWAAALISRVLPAFSRPLITGILAAASIGILAADTARLHPYYLAHYNRLYPVELTHKLGWGEGLERAAAWLRENADPTSTRAVTYYASILGRWYPGVVESLGHEYDEHPSDYVVLYRAMFGRELNSRETQYLSGYFRRGRCRHDIVINDLPYVWIFDRLPDSEAPGSRDVVQHHRDLLPLPACETREVLAS